MKRQVPIGWTLLVLVAAFAMTTAFAQKVHAPKLVWQSMIAGTSDIQSMTAALMVFDMASIESTANDLAARHEYISTIAELPDAVKEGHVQVAEAAQGVAVAAASGEDQDVATALSEVVSACTSCHYDLRDKERREKMQ